MGRQQFDDDPDTVNVISESFAEHDPNLVANARSGPNQVSSGRTTISAVPVSEPGVGGWSFWILDDRIDCVRLLTTPFPFETDDAVAYADTLVTGMNPQL